MPACRACARSVDCGRLDHCLDSPICSPPEHDLEVVASGFGACEGADVYVGVMEIDEEIYCTAENVVRSTVCTDLPAYTARMAAR